MASASAHCPRYVLSSHGAAAVVNQLCCGCGHTQVVSNPEEAERVLSQLKVVIRPMYSSPPVQGARIVAEILGDAELSAQWSRECASMAERIKSMRTLLVQALKSAGSGRAFKFLPRLLLLLWLPGRCHIAMGCLWVCAGDWSHIEKQLGMFCYSGLSPAQVARLISHHFVFMTSDGRISMAGKSCAACVRCSGGVACCAEAVACVDC